MRWLQALRIVAALFGVCGGALALLAVGFVPLGVVATAIAAIGGAEFSVGLTLGWKALDGFSTALKEAQALPKDARLAFRRESRKRRAAIAISMTLLAALVAISGACALGIRESRLSDPALETMLRLGGSAVGLGSMIFVGLFRQFFGSDDLIASVREKVADYSERERQVREMALVGGVEATVRDSIPLRRTASSG